MNRVGLGLAIGAGYVLGRTRKLKLAFAVGTLVAGKRMQLSPRALADLVSGQLRNNPQFKEIGDQLREDLRGVGGAASGALVERQLDALADRLHDRTAGVRERLGGVVPQRPDRRYGDEERPETEEPDTHGSDAEGPETEEPDTHGPDAEGPETEGPDAQEPVDEVEAESERPARKQAPAKKAAAKKAPARKAPAEKTAAKRTAARKTASAKSAARKPASARIPKGGGDR
ncbi:DNA primase [Streptomyces sp. F001]|uniref:DNA primase n=1 Tax=Streptomyces sp. F001 TaxID=1510026 RepID=UPI00101E5D17|nr:DNA primase [Streptomyces sp. F001]RZB16963.1 DNA primase [Streptomyces sp. F001]